MKYFLWSLAFISVSALAADTYLFDPDHTYVTWHVNHFGYSTLSGKIMAEGTMLLDEEKPENSKVSVTLHTASMQTGISQLDDTLKGANFFNTKEFSTASFRSDKVAVTGTNTAKVYGTLELRGIAKPVVLNVKLNNHGVHPYDHKKSFGFSADAIIKRSDFRMTGYLPGVSDQVDLDIQAEAKLGKAALIPEKKLTTKQ